MPSFSYNKGNEKEEGFTVDSKGQDILFNSEMKQNDLMIQMLSERLDEKDETITELKETINDLKDTIAGLRETLDEFQRKLFGTGSEKTKQDKKTEETVTTIVKSHKRTTRKAKATREDQYGNLPIHKEVIPCRKKISIVLIVIPRWSM